MDNPAFVQNEVPLKDRKRVSIKEDPPQDEQFQGNSNGELMFTVDDVPPWYLCLFLGLQHYLEMIGATIACPFFLAPALCMADDDPDKANIISTLVFMSGIITIFQSTLGTRLPIVQGGSFSYLVPSLAIMSLPRWKCPAADVFDTLSDAEKTELWQVRMREIQGAIIFAALFEALFALTGLIGYLVKYLTPLAIAPAISLIGISLFQSAAEEASKNYAVLLSVATVWAVCAILTVTDVLPANDAARTDSKLKIMTGSSWFRVPYPFQWGWPTVSIGAVLGMFCGVMTSTIESLGDYFACASIAKTTSPPIHALNRGIFIQGFGCVLSGFWGSGNASTSYSNNIGTIAVTRVASRRVIQVSGIIMIVMGLVGKAGAIFVSLPDPIIAGMFLFIFPLIMAVGISTLAEISLESARNVFIVSFSIFMGLTISEWAKHNEGVIQTGSEEADNLIQILLSTGMFVAGFIGFVLDNTISGTDEERGLTRRRKAQLEAQLAGDTSFDFPWGMEAIKT
ncbi:hypothetical protein HA402_011443 [Bradysia odoriphaga]|nr:hypothetical protein HA402_011443 [Bradysia odoriphaga]